MNEHLVGTAGNSLAAILLLLVGYLLFQDLRRRGPRPIGKYKALRRSLLGVSAILAVIACTTRWPRRIRMLRLALPLGSIELLRAECMEYNARVFRKAVASAIRVEPRNIRRRTGVSEAVAFPRPNTTMQ
jgi:hypothetical protein